MSHREIQELVEQLEQASDAYYGGDAIMADAEYDALLDELRALDPANEFLKRVGAASTAKFKKVKHGAPMGSLEKVQTPDEFAAWAQESAGKVAAAAKAGEIEDAATALVVSEKLDGMSISLKYEGGKLVQAVTRNDGITGDDITRNVELMQGLPKKARDLTGYVRGEIILRKSALAKHFPGYKNPRNTAAGTAKRESDPAPCKHLEIICYQIVTTKHNIQNKAVEFRLLEALGFTVPFWQLCEGDPAAEVRAVYDRYVAKDRDALDYDIDGLVVEHDSLAVMEHMGEHDMRPKGARAFKFPHEEQPTRLREIVWQVGNSGRVTPVAYFDAVTLAGASVSQASLHNIDNIHRLAAKCPQGMLGLSDMILVSRRNDVIPYVEKVIKPSSRARFAVPTECPSCSTRLIKSSGRKSGGDDGAYLMCPNERGCGAQQSGAVKRWVAKLDIKDWGEALIETLCANGMVSSPADLYGLDADDLAEVTLPPTGKSAGKRLGESTAKRVLKNLHAKKELRIADFVGSLGIDLWGRSMTQFIVDAGYDTLEKMEDASVAQLAAVPGVGQTKAEAFVDGFGRRKKMIDDLLAAGVTVKKPIVGGKLSGMSFCFTGIRDRTFEGEIQEAGGSVKGSVGKGLTYLVAKDPNSTSGKAKKARAQGTKVISLEEAKALL